MKLSCIRTKFQQENIDNLPVDYNSCSSIGSVYLEIIKPLPYLTKKINEKRNILENNYIAIHVRRTDHEKAAKENGAFTEDDDFFSFIDNHLSKNNYLIYVATDNVKTYNMFLEKYNDKIRFPYHEETNTYRNTSMENAIIDLYMCVYSKKFKKSGWSSFSVTVDNIRKILN